jgi:hypothetical protein
MPIWECEALVELCAALKRNRHTSRYLCWHFFLPNIAV